MTPDERTAREVIAGWLDNPSAEMQACASAGEFRALLEARLVAVIQAERAACAKILRDNVAQHRERDDRIADQMVRKGFKLAHRRSTGSMCEDYGCNSLLDLAQQIVDRGQG